MKTLKVLALAMMCVGAFTACNSSNKQESQSDEAAIEELTVDQIWANPDSFVGKEITITGVCSHLCKHGGRKAFIMPSNGTAPLRCDATPDMPGGAFAKETIHQPLAVTGTLREDRITEETIKAWEEQHAAQLAAMQAEGQAPSGEAAEEAAGGCATEKAAQGQAEINTFADRMADYRAKIAERTEREGKPYFSTYVFEAKSYQILPM